MSPSLLARDIQTATLSNGLKVITESMPHVRSVAAGIWIGSGSRRESAKENGLSHFIEHMLFKGTETRSAEEIARSMDSLGGHMDAFTGKELVGFNAKVLDEHVPRAFEVLSDLVLNPLFREEDIEKERSVILEELKMEVDNPEYLIHETFTSNFWRNHPIGRPILGTKRTITNFERPMMLDYYRRVYNSANMLITAAGNLRHDELLAQVDRFFGGRTGAEPLPPEEPPSTHAAIIMKNKRSLQQAHLCLGVPSYPLPHEQRFACYVLNTLLGGGMSSRLFQNIREKQGLVYAVYSELNVYRDTGCLLVSAGTAVESVGRVIQSVLNEFRDLKERPVPDEELRRAKDHLKGSLLLGLESTASRMANLARQEMYFHRFFSFDELAESVERVTAADLQSLAHEFFRPENIALTVLGRLHKYNVDRDRLVC